MTATATPAADRLHSRSRRPAATPGATSAPAATIPIASAPAAVQARFAQARAELSASLVERDDEIDLALTALAAGENLLLVGPPGAAKSLLLDSIADWLSGTRFTYLLTKFTTPEELFGPISLTQLKADRYVRVTTGRLPEADLAFLDEIFKASSAILNTLLRLLNERTFDPGTGAAPVPLQLCVAASNEWPNAENGGRELGALFDRFLLRKHVKYAATRAGRDRLLWDADLTPDLAHCRVTPADLAVARDAAAGLAFTDDARAALEAIVAELGKEGIRPSDRRLRKSLNVARAFAWTRGAAAVEPNHLEVLAHVLWDDPETQAQKAAQVVAKVANPVGMAINSALLDVEEVLAGVNPKDIAACAAATAKLNDVRKKLSAMSKEGNGRVAQALAYVDEQVKQLKAAAIGAL